MVTYNGSKLLLVKSYSYTIENSAIWLATSYVFVNRHWVADSNATRPSFSQEDNAYIFFASINNFEEIMNTSLL